MPLIQINRSSFVLLGFIILTINYALGIAGVNEPDITNKNDLNGLSFRKLEVLAHTSIGDVSAIEQGPRGFVWFGTIKGFYRYDGYRLKAFHNEKGNPESLASDEVNDIYKDSQNRLWVGSYQGVSLYLPKTETFKNYLSGKSWPNKIVPNRVNVILEDNEGRILVSTESGFVYYLDEKEDRFLPINPHPFGYIKSLEKDPHNRLWIGSEQGIFYYDIDSNKSKYFDNYLGVDKGVINNYINAIAYVDDENIWLGTSSNGVVILNSLTGKIKPLKVEIGEQYVTQIDLISENRILTVSNGGIIIYNRKGEIIQRISNDTNNGEVPSSGIATFYSDTQGNHWMGSHWDGIAISTVQKQFHKVSLSDQAPDSPVTAVLIDSLGNFWVGDNRSGVHVYPKDGSSPINYKHDPDDANSISAQPILKIFEDSRGDIWLGTYRGGLYRFVPDTRSFVSYLINNDDPNSISSHDIREFQEDEKGNLWINSHGGGIDYLNVKTGIFTNYNKFGKNINHSIADNWSFCITYDDKKRLWVGSSEGVSVIHSKDGTTSQFKADEMNPRSISHSSITSIFIDTTGKIWLGSSNGLNHYIPETNDFDTYTTTSGFPCFKNIKSIIEDNEGRLWIGTADKLVRFDPDTLETKLYSSTDGLASNDFFIGSTFKDVNGVLYFGQTRGITKFDPSKIHDNKVTPKALITNVLVFNKSIPIIPNSNDPKTLNQSILDTKRIKLNYDQKVISFEFTGLSYIQSHKNQYSYILQGFDKNWSTPSYKREVTYTNLNPGTYIFRVKSSNNDGYWSKKDAHIEIVILPPFWKTNWFIALCLIIALTLPGVFIYWRISNTKKKQHALEKAVEERTQQLKQANKDREEAYSKIVGFHKELEHTVKERTKELEVAKFAAEQSDRLKSAFLANMSHEIRTPMNAIIGFLSFMDDEDLSNDDRTRYRKIINQNSEALLALIDDILDLARIEAGEIEIINESVNIQDFCEELHLVAKSTTSPQKGIIISRKDTSENPSKNQCARLDRLRVRQILLNLLSNSIKFTEDGEVSLEHKIIEPTGKQNTGLLVFKVKDSGIGIPQDQIDNIFGRFQKIEDKGKLYPGTGLGLTISKKLSEFMNGKIEVVSEQGKGTEFTVTLPYYPAKKPLAASTTSPSLENKQETMDLSDFTVLVAEDESPNYEYIRNILKKSSIKILWAKDGIEALSLYESNSVDLILLDINMPRMEGHQVAREIRKTNLTIPIIAQSAHAMENDRIEALNAGANDYLSKPFRAKRLLRLVEKHLY